MVVGKYMVVIRSLGSLWTYSWCYIRDGPKGPALMVVVKYMVVIRVIASL